MSRIICKSFVYALKKSVPKLSSKLRGPVISQYSKMSSDAEAIKNPLVWIDMEMTGLDATTDKVLEIAVLITDRELNIVAEGPNLVVHQDDTTLSTMNSWCIEQHGKTGLTQACKESTVSVEQAEEQVMQFISQYVKPGQSPLAGSTVYMDRRFLERYMPRVDKYLHYRLVDVSSIRELAKMWYPEEVEKAPKKGGSHRALDDIKDSVKQLQYYRTTIFKPSS